MSEIAAKSQALRQEMTLENLFRLTSAYGDRIAARYLEGDEEKSLSFAQYEQLTYARAAYLRGVVGAENAGRFIGIQMDTCPDWYTVFWGVIAAGYNALLIDFSFSDEMTAYILEQADAVAVIARGVRAFSRPVVQITHRQLLAATEEPRGFSPSFGDRVALCTSGTTDTSRIFVYDGAALCHQVLNSELIHNINRRIIPDTQMISLAFLPFHHVFGFVAGLLWMSFCGGENVYLHDRSPKTIQATARRFRVTHLLAVPLLANNLAVALNKKVRKESWPRRVIYKCGRAVSLGIQIVAPGKGLDFARNTLFRGVISQLLGGDIKCVILGGSHTPREHMVTLSALGYYTVCGFGMTETAITSLETGMNIFRRVSGSVGVPLSSAEYRVQSDGRRSGSGEMFIRGNTIHTGCLKDGKLLPPQLDAEGWFRTGDVVRLEKGSRMYVEGRAKDVIINESGENVYPDEIEDAFGALGQVEQYCVLGVRAAARRQRAHLPRRKQEMNYEDITLVVNVGDHYRDDQYLYDIVQKIRQINNRLPTLKRVTRVLATPERFSTAGGIKVRRLALKKDIEEGRIAYRDVELKPQGDAAQTPAVVTEQAPTDLQMDEIKRKVRRIYAETLDIPESQVRDDAHFIDEMGGDSLQVLGMSLKVEELFNVLIPTEEYGRCTTVNDLSSLLYARIRGDNAYEKESDRRSENVVPITRFEDTPEYQAFHKRQQALLEGHENPYFICHESSIQDVSIVDGEEVLNFGSYNYVGMSGRPETEQAAKDAIDKYGTSASGSRLLGGEKQIHKDLEKEIAEWKHAEDALVLVGGHSTNVTCVGNFCGPNDLIVYDALAHNSVAQGCRLSHATAKPFPHSDTAALESILRTQRRKFEKVLIIAEGAYSMDGDIAPVPELVRIKKEYGCFLMIDEAHSACVIGKTGGGVDEYFGLEPNDIDIKMGTLSKGLGSCGGYLAGPRVIIEYMRYNLPGFVFSVGLSPALAGETLCAVRLLRSDTSIIERLHGNIKCFIEEAHKRNLNTCLAGETAIIPILVGRDEDAFLLSNMLRKVKVFVPPAVYPAVPKNKARLRFCVISEHKPEQIVRALDCLLDCAKEAKIALPPQ